PAPTPPSYRTPPGHPRILLLLLRARPSRVVRPAGRFGWPYVAGGLWRPRFGGAAPGYRGGRRRAPPPAGGGVRGSRTEARVAGGGARGGSAGRHARTSLPRALGAGRPGPGRGGAGARGALRGARAGEGRPELPVDRHRAHRLRPGG